MSDKPRPLSDLFDNFRNEQELQYEREQVPGTPEHTRAQAQTAAFEARVADKVARVKASGGIIGVTTPNRASPSRGQSSAACSTKTKTTACCPTTANPSATTTRADVDIIKWIRDGLRPRPVKNPPRFIAFVQSDDDFIKHDHDDVYVGTCGSRFDVDDLVIMPKRGQHRVVHIEWSGDDFKARLEFVKGSM